MNKINLSTYTSRSRGNPKIAPEQLEKNIVNSLNKGPGEGELQFHPASISKNNRKLRIISKKICKKWQ